jgi:hypothetical protein
LIAVITGCDTESPKGGERDAGAGDKSANSAEPGEIASGTGNVKPLPTVWNDLRLPDPSSASAGNAQIARRSGSRVTIGHKYSAQEDMWIVFDHHGANRLYGFSQWRLAANTAEQVDPDLNRASEVLQNAVTDWIGPYIVEANENGTGSGTLHFTGGAHAYNGDDKGSATARTVSCGIWSDGIELEDGQLVRSDKITIRVVNHIQGYNTKLEEGSGREILKETITYEIVGGRVQVHAEIEALEDVTFYRYYGLQTVNTAWSDQVLYAVGNRIAAVSPGKSYSDSGKLSANPDVDRYVLISDGSKRIRHHLLVWLDRKYGIGTMEHVAAQRPAAFTYEYGKTYFLQIADTSPVLSKGETYFWRGGYHFYSETVNKQ